MCEIKKGVWLEMRAAAYCRVSTDKTDQLNSLETQKEFFAEYTRKEGLELVYLYADEGISGTKLKNRTEFLQMMQETRRDSFDIVFSEFTLTIMAATLEQEESANMSELVKFRKWMNLEKGRVPNFVYDYDKTNGDYFHLHINEAERTVIQQIYDWYMEDLISREELGLEQTILLCVNHTYRYGGIFKWYGERNYFAADCRCRYTV